MAATGADEGLNPQEVLDAASRRLRVDETNRQLLGQEDGRHPRLFTSEFARELPQSRERNLIVEDIVGSYLDPLPPGRQVMHKRFCLSALLRITADEQLQHNHMLSGRLSSEQRGKTDGHECEPGHRRPPAGAAAGPIVIRLASRAPHGRRLSQTTCRCTSERSRVPFRARTPRYVCPGRLPIHVAAGIECRNRTQRARVARHHTLAWIAN